jgi:hypothetical protein
MVFEYIGFESRGPFNSKTSYKVVSNFTWLPRNYVLDPYKFLRKDLNYVLFFNFCAEGSGDDIFLKDVISSLPLVSSGRL